MKWVAVLSKPGKGWPPKTEYMGTYIGDSYMIPKVLVNAVKVSLGKRKLKSHDVTYYGEPDEYLRDKFGYPQTEKGVCAMCVKWNGNRCYDYMECIDTSKITVGG